MTLLEFNTISKNEAATALSRCCGSKRWIEQMMERHPFISEQELFTEAERIWKALSEDDWKEAFTHHPKIGDAAAIKKKFAATSAWAEGEQRGVQNAADETMRLLAEGNAEYEKKFGFIFIVCATGKSAEEMLSLLEVRLRNNADNELRIAADEQRKITQIRLQKIFSSQ